MESISAIKAPKMDVTSVVQVTGKSLDKMYVGCVGIILEKKEITSVVGLYSPSVSGKFPFVKEVEFKDEDISLIGDSVLKPNLKKK